MVGHGGSSASSYLTDPTSPIPSHCASIVVTSTLRVNVTCTQLTPVPFNSVTTCHTGQQPIIHRLSLNNLGTYPTNSSWFNEQERKSRMLYTEKTLYIKNYVSCLSLGFIYIAFALSLHVLFSLLLLVQMIRNIHQYD